MKARIMRLSIMPILVMGIAILLLTVTVIKSRLTDDIEMNLKGIAAAYIAAYDQNVGEYSQNMTGAIYKGAYKINESEALVDGIKANSGVDVTFYFGSREIMTSIVDAEGRRVLGLEIDKEIAEKVLNGETLFLKNIEINEEKYYGYYAPVYQYNSDEIIGIVFAASPVSQENLLYNTILVIIVTAVILSFIIFIIVASVSAGNISRAIEAGTQAVKAVAAGQLAVEIDSKYMDRNDVIGELCRAVNGMKDELRYIIGDLNSHAQSLLSSADTLDNNAQETLNTVDHVERAVNEIADGANAQAKDAVRTTENVTMMGEMLAATNSEIEHLLNNAQMMKDASSQATQSLHELKQVNDEVMAAIDQIYQQTNRTNESSLKIKEVTNIISSISDETNLLSLNASIEAARAGEQGRGFAVVANQIQRLAEQSGTSTSAIADMISELIYDSNMAVETMQRVQGIVLEQSKNVEETERIVDEVIQSIEESIMAISSIEQQSNQLNIAKEEIIELVENLSAIAEENAASTEETSAATTEVANSFNDVTEAAEALKGIADGIVETVGAFQLD